MAVTPIDPNLFLIMKVLDRYGHEKLTLKIIKEKQSYIVGHERYVPQFLGKIKGARGAAFTGNVEGAEPRDAGEGRAAGMRSVVQEASVGTRDLDAARGEGVAGSAAVVGPSPPKTP